MASSQFMEKPINHGSSWYNTQFEATYGGEEKMYINRTYYALSW